MSDILGFFDHHNPNLLLTIPCTTLSHCLICDDLDLWKPGQYLLWSTEHHPCFFMNESSVMLITFKSPEPNLFKFLPVLGMMLPFLWNGNNTSSLCGLLTMSSNRAFQGTTLQQLCLLNDMPRDVHEHI